MTTVTLITSKEYHDCGNDVYAFETVSDEKTDYIKEHNRELHKKLFGTNVDDWGKCVLYHDWKRGNTLRVSKYNGAPKRLTEMEILLNPESICCTDHAWKTLSDLYDPILNSFWTSSLIEKDLYAFMHALYLRDCGSGIICVPEIIVKGNPMPEIGETPVPSASTIRCGPGTKIQHGQWGVRLYYYMLWDDYFPMEYEGAVCEDASNLRAYLSKPDLISRVPDICAKSISKCELLLDMIKVMNSEGSAVDNLMETEPPKKAEPVQENRITVTPPKKAEPVQENRITVSPTKGEIEKAANVLLNKLLERNSITKVIPILECALQEAKIRK